MKSTQKLVAIVKFAKLAKELLLVLIELYALNNIATYNIHNDVHIIKPDDIQKEDVIIIKCTIKQATINPYKISKKLNESSNANS